MTERKKLPEQPATRSYNHLKKVYDPRRDASVRESQRYGQSLQIRGNASLLCQMLILRRPGKLLINVKSSYDMYAHVRSRQKRWLLVRLYKLAYELQMDVYKQLVGRCHINRRFHSEVDAGAYGVVFSGNC